MPSLRIDYSPKHSAMLVYFGNQVLAISDQHLTPHVDSLFRDLAVCPPSECATRFDALRLYLETNWPNRYQPTVVTAATETKTETWRDRPPLL